MRRSLISVLASTVVVGLVGCAAALYLPTEEDAVPGAPREELLQGRHLYVQKCGSCHALHLPENYTGLEWQNHLREMALRARLSDQEENLIWKFLFAGTVRTKKK